MSKIVWWIFAASIPIALIIMVVSILIVKSKVTTLTKKYNKNKILIRKNAGKLLWDLKDKTKNPLNDYVLEFLINTCFKNKYKSFNTIGFLEKYEEKTFKKIAKLEKVTKDYDLLLINFDKDLINKIYKIHKKIKKKSLIAIVNINNKKIKKEFISYLKLIGFRYEFQKIGNGIILIAK